MACIEGYESHYIVVQKVQVTLGSGTCFHVCMMFMFPLFICAGSKHTDWHLV